MHAVYGNRPLHAVHVVLIGCFFLCCGKLGPYDPWRLESQVVYCLTLTHGEKYVVYFGLPLGP